MNGPLATRICPRCGSDSQCAYGQDTPCWCATEFARVMPLEASAQACYCRRCLEELIQELDQAAAGGSPSLI